MQTNPTTEMSSSPRAALGASVSQSPQSLLNTRVSSPRLLNPQAAQATPRASRPRTPLSQQQLPQQQQQQQQQQQMQHVIQQQMHPQQLNHINKLIPHQQQIILSQQQNQHLRVINTSVSGASQPGRVITPQGTIVQPMSQQNHLQQQTVVSQLPQNSTQLALMSQRSSPSQQIKKVVVQPNNTASDMDDLEESITAAVLSKHPINEPQQQFHNAPAMRQSNAAPQFNFQSPHQYPQQVNYEPQQPQHAFNQMMMETDGHGDDDGHMLTFSNGQCMTLSEYKRIQQPSHPIVQQQLSRDTGWQTVVTRKEPQRPVQRVPPMQSHAQPPHDNSSEGTVGISEQNTEPQSAKMLIFLQNGEQRLITFTLPKESCTLQEVLEQVNVPCTEDTHIQCVQNSSSEIDYFVSVGSTTRIEEMLENHPILMGDLSSRSSPSLVSQSQSTDQSTPEKMQNSDNVQNSPESPRSPPPRFIDGMLALCKTCGYTGFDHNRCQRCRRIFTEEPKSVPMASTKVDAQKKDSEKLHQPSNCSSLLDKTGITTVDTIKLNLLKPNMKQIKNHTAVGQEKKQPRVRKPRGKQPDPEPVILTLSSDEEDSNSSTIQNEYSVSTKEPSLSEIEGGTPDSGIGMDHDDNSSSPGALQGIMTSLQCRTIRIGSYKYTPKEKVYISSKGIKIVAPSLKDETKEVALQIQIKELVRLLVHFGKTLPVIFLYTRSMCGHNIRKSLDMSDESGPYYNPVSKADAFKRITLLPEIISEEAKMSLKKLFGKVMDELSPQEANEILCRTSPHDTNTVNKMVTRSSTSLNVVGAKSANPAEIRQILIYPPGKGGIPINTEDYMCLAQDQFLNDVIIDFYLKHLVRDVLTASQREKTHIFSTFFYKRLTTKPSKMNKSSNPHEWDSTLTPAQKRHARVKTWTKNVNIFEKDFIVVPINENCHWFVAIICYPSLEGCRSMIDNRTVQPQKLKKRERASSVQIGNTTITPLAKQEQLTCDSDNLSERDEAEAEESDLDMQCDSDEEEPEKPVIEKKIEVLPLSKNEPIKQPCILIFDSLAGASRSRVVATLRDYLTCEFNIKISASKKFTKDNIKGACPKIPQQNNFTDCGLYLLQYVEQFFKDPVMDYSLPIKQLANWFDEIVVTRKREEISELLKHLIQEYNPDGNISLPDIVFPTLNGKLVETEADQQEGEAAEGDVPSRSSKPDDCEPRTLTLVKQTPSGELVLKRNFSDSSDTIHLRKTIRLSNDSENRSLVQIKPEFIKKGDNDSQIIIPIKLHSDLVKDIQNTLIANKNKTMSDKKHSVNSQNVSSANCIKPSESDTNSLLKSRRINKFEDSINESSKKFKKSEC